VRELARSAGLAVAEKGESMEVCFVAGSVREFVEQQVARRPERFAAAADGRPSELVDARGERLAAGEPYYRYTVTARIGVAASGRCRPEVLPGPTGGDRRGGSARHPGLLGATALMVRNRPLLALDRLGREITATVTSALSSGVLAEIRPLGDGEVEVRFATPQRGVAPGQAAVFYEGSRVLGGCWIASPLPV
jgi:tRNA-specific 2-thiouridylase